MTKHDKQTIPSLRFKGFDGAWEEKILGESARFAKGSGYSKSDLTTEGLPVILYGRLYTQYESIIENVDTFVSYDENALKSSGNEVIVPASGETAEDIARASAVYQKGVIFGGDLNVVTPNKDIAPSFLALTLTHGKSNQELSKKAQGKSVVHLRNDDLKACEISFPTLPEQTQLGNFFRQLDHRITESRALWEKSRQLKKAMLTKMFPAAGETIPKIRFKGFSGEWERKTLGEVGNTFGGLTNKSREDFGHGEARYITYMNVYQNPISSLDQLDSIEIDEKQNEVKKGDVLFTTSSETPEEVGMSSVWTFEKENVYLNSFCFGYRLNEKIDLNYLAYCLRSDCVRSQMILLAQGISRYNISKKGVMEIEILIPSPEEQTAIGNFFRQLDDTIALHALETEKLGYLKKALLAAMLV